tara:strand:- start:484 stop:849 length:366 start_codon:yes stop_codon:yes gene_type:complete
MQKGGINPQLAKDIRMELAERAELERMQATIQKAYELCVEGIGTFLPPSIYDNDQRSTICEFIVENREDLIENGFPDTHAFATMFSQMVDNLMEKKDVSQEKAFLVVMRASYRMIGKEPEF